MKKRLQKFLRWLGLIPFPQPSQVILFPDCPEWTAEDAAHWKTFLSTPTGQSLWKKARAMQIANCVKACDGHIEPKLASGISFTLNWLEKLAIISSASDAKDAQTEDSLRENADTLIPEFSH